MAQLSKDVYRGFKFSVEIDGFKRAAFQKVSGLKTAIEVVEYREGNMPDRMEKLPGMKTFDAVTFERGLSDDTDFLDWINEVSITPQAGGAGVPASSVASDLPDSISSRRNVVINLHDRTGGVVKAYTLIGAWCSEYSMGDFDATSQDVVLSTLVVQHHGIVETSFVQP